MLGKKLDIQDDGTSPVQLNRLTTISKEHISSGGADSARIDSIRTEEENDFQKEDYELALKKASRPKEGRRG